MQNNRPTYMFVLAKKIARRELFAPPPQQSDYADEMETACDEAHSFAQRRSGRGLRHILPANLKEKLRPYAANISIRHRYPCYIRLDESALSARRIRTDGITNSRDDITRDGFANPIWKICEAFPAVF